MLGNHSVTHKTRQLIRELAAHRKNILAGNFPAVRDIEPLVAEVALALADVPDHDRNEVQRLLGEVSRQAVQNDKLIKASLAGLASARQQVAAQEAARNELGTYSMDGQRTNLAAGASRHSKTS